MTNAEDKPLPAVGVYWVKEENYPALLKILEDGNKLPPSWTEWRKMAEEMERGLKAYGHPVMRVTIPTIGQSSWGGRSSISRSAWVHLPSASSPRR